MKKKFIYIGAILALGGLAYWKFGMKPNQKDGTLDSAKPSKDTKPSGEKVSVGVSTKDTPQTIDAPEIPDTSNTGGWKPPKDGGSETPVIGQTQPVGTSPMPSPPIITTDFPMPILIPDYGSQKTKLDGLKYADQEIGLNMNRS